MSIADIDIEKVAEEVNRQYRNHEFKELTEQEKIEDDAEGGYFEDEDEEDDDYDSYGRE